MKRKNIKTKIWRVMLLTITALSLILFSLNVVIIQNIARDIIYEELEEELENSYEKHPISDDMKEYYEDHNHNETFFKIKLLSFTIKNVGDDEEIVLDHKTEAMSKSKSSDILHHDFIPHIRSDLEDVGFHPKKGKVRFKGHKLYYMAKRIDNGKSIIVYFADSKSSPQIYLLFLLVFLLFILLSYLASKYISKQLSKPIEELESYAQKISNRDWNAVEPSSDTAEIEKLTHSMKKMKDALKTAEDLDRDFLQKTSHDLKTPVMIIKGYAQAMIDGVTIQDDMPPQEVILSEATRLERKIKQLLYINTISHSLETHERYDNIRIDRLIKSLVSKFKVVKPDISWETQLIPFEIKGNTESFLVAFENIFDNQTRYAKNSIKVMMDQTSDSIEIQIENDGPHFTMDDPSVLFNSYKKDMEGNFGLGLAIVKKVIEGHNGRISAYNTEDGVVFKISLKLINKE